jgi:hypothetical protein
MSSLLLTTVPWRATRYDNTANGRGCTCTTWLPRHRRAAATSRRNGPNLTLFVFCTI